MLSRALSGFKCKCPRAERISIRRRKYKTCPIFLITPCYLHEPVYLFILYDSFVNVNVSAESKKFKQYGHSEKESI